MTMRELESAVKLVAERLISNAVHIEHREGQATQTTSTMREAAALLKGFARSEGPHPDQSAEVGSMVPHPESGEAIGYYNPEHWSRVGPGRESCSTIYPQPAGTFRTPLYASPPPLKGEALPVAWRWRHTAEVYGSAATPGPWNDGKPPPCFPGEAWRYETQPLYAHPSPGVSREEVAGALAGAFEAGCLAVQNNYEPNPDPEFGEAASDYAASVIDALLSRGEG